MLALFAFSITPKLLLHDLVANHKDTPLKCGDDNNQKFIVAGFNCDCDNLVVESPFVHTFFDSEIIVPQIFSQYINSAVKDPIAVNQFYFELRGPPSMA